MRSNEYTSFHLQLAFSKHGVSSGSRLGLSFGEAPGVVLGGEGLGGRRGPVRCVHWRSHPFLLGAFSASEGIMMFAARDHVLHKKCDEVCACVCSGGAVQMRVAQRHSHTKFCARHEFSHFVVLSE